MNVHIIDLHEIVEIKWDQAVGFLIIPRVRTGFFTSFAKNAVIGQAREIFHNAIGRELGTCCEAHVAGRVNQSRR